jgi:hypothetical protein
LPHAYRCSWPWVKENDRELRSTQSTIPPSSRLLNRRRCRVDIQPTRASEMLLSYLDESLRQAVTSSSNAEPPRSPEQQAHTPPEMAYSPPFTRCQHNATAGPSASSCRRSTDLLPREHARRQHSSCRGHALTPTPI